MRGLVNKSRDIKTDVGIIYMYMCMLNWNYFYAFCNSILYIEENNRKISIACQQLSALFCKMYSHVYLFCISCTYIICVSNISFLEVLANEKNASYTSVNNVICTLIESYMFLTAQYAYWSNISYSTKRWRAWYLQRS